MNAWFVVYCKSGKDHVAEHNLLRQHFVIYRPRTCITHAPRSQSAKLRYESLFPRYLFVRINTNLQMLTPIKYTRGVAGFVRFGDKYPTVDDSVISEIKECEKSQADSADTVFSKGDTVYINDGSFNNIKATFIEQRSEDRVSVLLHILGNASTVEVASSSVSTVSMY